MVLSIIGHCVIFILLFSNFALSELQNSKCIYTCLDQKELVHSTCSCQECSTVEANYLLSPKKKSLSVSPAYTSKQYNKLPLLRLELHLQKGFH